MDAGCIIPPLRNQQTTEGKKVNFEAAELDQEFLDRIWQLDYEQILIYLQALPDEVREAMEEAINRSISHQVMKNHKQHLQGGLEI